MLFSPFFAKAQNKIADSLLKNLPASKADTNRVILLNKIAFALYTTDYQKSLAYCTQAGSLATKLHYLKGQALNSHIQGVVYTFKDDYATALIKEQQAASLALKTNDFALLAKAYNAAGLIYSRLNDAQQTKVIMQLFCITWPCCTSTKNSLTAGLKTCLPLPNLTCAIIITNG